MSQIDVSIGTTDVPFLVNKDIFERYYTQVKSQEQLWWSDPQSKFFGNFYQTGDQSLNGYLSTIHQTLQERTAEEVQGILELLQLPKGATILDCPCGIGRHTIELAKYGYKLFGVDISYDQIKVGVEQATKENVNNITFVLDDMRSQQIFFRVYMPLLGGEFVDAAINMFYSFGFFATDEQNTTVLQNFFKLLKPGGKFLMHTDVNLARIRSGVYKFEEERPLEHGVLRIIDTYNSETKRIDGCWIIGNERKDYSVRVYDVEEFINLCKEVGFRNVEVYSDWSGSPYSHDSEMLIFIATK